MRKRVYLDLAAPTPLDPRVLEAMLPYLSDAWGNPSSIYAEAQQARKGLEDARRTVAEVLGCKPQEIVFTSGGTESDSLALRGVAYGSRRRGSHIVTSAIEHHAVLHTAERLEQEGFRVTYLPVDGEGLIDPAALERAVGEDTTLVSIMLANNEVGTIEPIAEAARIVKEKNPHTAFHTDAVQAVGTLEVSVDRLGVDLLSIGAHKFYGPKGVGALYVRSRTPLQAQVLGGAQEKNRRAGTENVAYVVGMAKAMALDLQGVAASSGSACTSGSLEPSHVLTAMGVPLELARGSLRLTVGIDNTREEIDYLLEILPGIVSRLRSLSPTWPEREAAGAATEKPL